MSKKHTLWLAVGMVALLLVGVLAGIAPRLRVMDRLDSEALSLQDRARRADNGAAEIVRLESHLADVQEIEETSIKDIPAENDVAGLIRALTTRLDRLGMTEREITTGAIEALEDAMAAPMTVRMRGPFLGVQEAVEWLESLPRLVRVLRVKIETPNRSASDRLAGGSADVEAELILNVFFDAVGFSNDGVVANAEGGGDAHE